MSDIGEHERCSCGMPDSICICRDGALVDQLGSITERVARRLDGDAEFLRAQVRRIRDPRNPAKFGPRSVSTAVTMVTALVDFAEQELDELNALSDALDD